MRRVVSAILLLLAAWSPALAQEMVWSIDFQSVFNNREGGDEMRPDQTFLFTRLSPEVGVNLSADAKSSHLLKGGISWYEPLNDQGHGYKVVPTLYYQYRRDTTWQATVGTLPRTLLRTRAPRYLWSDSLDYQQPNIRGVMARYSHGTSYVETYLDWRQMQSENRREAFNFDLNGKWYPAHHSVWLGGYFQYSHLAKRKNAPESEGVNDDLTINPMLGGQWGVAKVAMGAIVNRERARVDEQWLTAAGFVANANLRWRFLEAEQNIYTGKDLFPLYPRFGSLLNLGDTYYRDKFYSRTDLIAHIVKNRLIDLNASLTLHATNKTTGFWQQISCRVYIDSSYRKISPHANSHPTVRD